MRGIAAAIALGVVVSGAVAADASRLAVVATTTDARALVEAIGGDQVAVESLTAPDHDPHAIELKPAQLARLQRAALVVRIGLDHEPWLARLRTEAPVLDLSRGVALLQTETPRLRVERRTHVHAYGNPHYWLDPANARPMVAAIAVALAKLRPDATPAFEARRAAFVERLDRRMAEWTQRLAPYRGARLVVVHDSWTYFAARFELAIVASAEPTPGMPPSAAELGALIARMREANVRVLVADPYSSPSVAKTIATKSGATLVTLEPSVRVGGEYLEMIDANVRRLTAALEQQR